MDRRGLRDRFGFTTGRLGMQGADHGGSMRAFRMDGRKQRLILDSAWPKGERVLGREVDDATWQPIEMPSLGSLWGHHGLFDSIIDGPPPGEAPPSMPPQPIRRAPLDTMDGSYERMSGVCPWWDAARAGREVAIPGA